MRPDVDLRQFSFGHANVVVGLQAKPELRGHPEIFGETDSGIGGDGVAFTHDLIYAGSCDFSSLASR